MTPQSKHVRRVPELRFPNFSEGWTIHKLGDIGTISGGGTPDTNVAGYWNGSINWFTPTEITKKFSHESRRKISNEGLRNSSAKLLPKGTLLLTSRATIGHVSILENISTTNQGFQSVIVQEGYSNEFVYYWLLQNTNELLRRANGSTFLEISGKDVKKIPIKIPTLLEQRKVAEFFSSLDTWLETLRKQKELLEQYKKGVMQKIYSQEIRFKDENGKDFSGWEKVQLKDVLVEHKTKNSEFKYTEVLSVAKNSGVINQIQHLGRSFAADNISNYNVIFPGDIVYTKSPTTGFPFGIIKQSKLDRAGVVSPLYGVFKPSNAFIGSILHEYFLSSLNTSNYLAPLVTKGAKNTINIKNKDFLNGARLLLPQSGKEQEKIVDFIKLLNDVIVQQERILVLAERWKKGLLQRMLV